MENLPTEIIRTIVGEERTEFNCFLDPLPKGWKVEDLKSLLALRRSCRKLHNDLQQHFEDLCLLGSPQFKLTADPDHRKDIILLEEFVRRKSVNEQRIVNLFLFDDNDCMRATVVSPERLVETMAQLKSLRGILPVA